MWCTCVSVVLFTYLCAFKGLFGVGLARRTPRDTLSSLLNWAFEFDIYLIFLLMIDMLQLRCVMCE